VLTSDSLEEACETSQEQSLGGLAGLGRLRLQGADLRLGC